MSTNVIIVMILFIFGISLALLAIFSKVYPRIPLIILSSACFLIGGFILYISYTMYQDEDNIKIYTDLPSEVEEHNKKSQENLQASK